MLSMVWMIIQFSSLNVPELKLKFKWSDSLFLSSLLPRGVNQTDTFIFTTVSKCPWVAVLPSAPWSLCLLCAQWLPFNRKYAQQKLFSFDSPWAGLNPSFKTHYWDEGNSNEGKIRWGAQCRWTVLPYVLYLAEVVILFNMPSLYRPGFPTLFPQDSL